MRQSNVVTEASLGTRASQWWAVIPFVTAVIVTLCSSIYLLELFLGFDSFYPVCLLPHQVVTKFQVYRLYSSVVFHASIFHVVFNMLALVPIGSSLERIMGSVRFLYVLLLLATSNGIIHTVLTYLAAHNPVYDFPALSLECAIGFSGVIFALIVIETSLTGTQTRSIFGFFNLPANLYPWALLLFFQLLMPSVSLLGHLSGILTGFAYTYGLFNVFLLSSSTYSAVESWWALSFCVRRPGFIVGGSAVPSTLPSATSTGGISHGLGGFWNGLQTMIPRSDATPPPSDERFPGRGRTLGAVTGAPPRQVSPEGLTGHSHRLLDRDSSSEMQPLRTSSPVERHVPGLNHLDTTSPQSFSGLQQAGVDDSAVQKLVAMGFEKVRAVHALSASNGDVSLAVEFLSAEGRD